MKNEHWNLNKTLTYLFISVAIAFTLIAIIPGYPGQVILPLLKALMLFLAVYIYGFFFMNLFKSHKENLDFTTAFAVGLMLTGLFFYLISFFKILVPPVITAFYLIPLILLFFIIKNQRQALIQKTKFFFNRSPLEYLPFLLPLIYASLPPTFYDSLVYHLGVPNLYLQHGGFLETSQFLFANTSIYYEISLIPAVFAGDMVPRLFHFFVGAVFFLAAADFAVEIFKIKKRYILLLLLLSMPMSVFLLSTVKADLLSAFYIFLGVRFLIKKQFAFSAVFWGFAIGVKYTNGIPLIVFLVIFFIKERQFPLKRIIGFGMVITAMLMPLLVKNYILAKNPFFPFFNQFFKAEYWDASRYTLMKADVGKMFYSLMDMVKFPFTLSFGQFGFGGMVGAQFLIFLPFLLVVREKLKNNWYLLIFAVPTLYLGGQFRGSLRFLFILFVFLSFYLAVIYESVNKKIVKYLFFIIISMNFISALASQELIYRSYQLFFQRQNIEKYKTSMFPAYPGIDYVNRHTPPGSRVLLLGEARSYYLKRPFLAATGIDYSILTKYLRQAENPAAFLNALRNDKIDYIIFNISEFNRLQKNYQRLDETLWNKMILYLKPLQSRIVFQHKAISVYKISDTQNLQ